MAYKTVEERIALIDEKIERKQKEIETLEAKKYTLLHPATIKTVISKAKEAGMTAQDIAEKLGIDL